MTSRLVVIAIALALLLRPGPAAACKCVGPSVATAVKRADAVFWGEVTAITREDHRSAITVTVHGVWKGTVPSTVTVYSGFTSCTILSKILRGGIDCGQSVRTRAR